MKSATKKKEKKAAPVIVLDTVKKGMSIRPEAVASTMSRQPLMDFSPARPPRGVVPAGTKPMALDDYGLSMFSDYQGMFSGAQWLGYPFLAELAQIPEYRLVSETIAKEMTRKWIKLNASGDNDKSDKIKTIEDELKRHKIQDKFRKLAELDGFFGRGHLFVDVGVTDPDLLKVPMHLSANLIKKNALSFHVVEPMWAYPNRYNATNPLAEDFYRPSTWFVMAQEVHRSRFLTLVSREMPDMLKAAYSFGGLSLSQMIMESVGFWQKTRKSVSDLISSFSTMVLKTDMSSVLEAGGGEAVAARAKIYNNYRDNNGLFMLDRLEEFSNVSTPLGTLDHLQAQAQEHIASVAGIPLVVLTGITPSGLNASSEGELQVWAQRVHSMQEHLFRDPLKLVLEVIQIDQFGAVDPEIVFDFEPLKEASEEEEGKARRNEAEMDQIYANIGWIGPEEGRLKLASQADSPYAGIDLSAPPPPMPEVEADPLGGNSGNGNEDR
jgi:phage-related protein (TIGR01555 family)